MALGTIRAGIADIISRLENVLEIRGATGQGIDYTATAHNFTGDISVSGAMENASLPMFACRAWVNFDGTVVTNVGGEDRCTIRSSGNIEKVVRVGTGLFNVYFITAIPIPYCVVGHATQTGTFGRTISSYEVSATVRTSTMCPVNTNFGSAWVASDTVDLAVFR